PDVYTLSLHDALPILQRHFNTYGYIMNRLGQLQDEQVPEAYGFYSVVLEPGLRPARPKGIVDTAFREIDPDQEAMMQEMERKEADRKSTRLNSSHVKI